VNYFAELKVLITACLQIISGHVQSVSHTQTK